MDQYVPSSYRVLAFGFGGALVNYLLAQIGPNMFEYVLFGGPAFFGACLCLGMRRSILETLIVMIGASVLYVGFIEGPRVISNLRLGVSWWLLSPLFAVLSLMISDLLKMTRPAPGHYILIGAVCLLATLPLTQNTDTGFHLEQGIHSVKNRVIEIAHSFSLSVTLWQMGVTIIFSMAWRRKLELESGDEGIKKPPTA